MKSQDLLRPRNLVIALLILFGVIATAVLVSVSMFIRIRRPETNLQSAGVQAKQLIAAVGGPTKVRQEANEMFARFGVSEEKFLGASELKAYPAVATLGTGHVILPGSPPRISIRVGTHLNGFFIEIADTNAPEKYAKSPGTLELINSGIFVHR